MTELLDSSVRKTTVNDGPSNLMDRIRHFYIDGFLVFFVSITLLLSLTTARFRLSGENDNLLTLLILFIVYAMYYTSLEFLFGFTIGKFLNKTRLMSQNELKPTIKQVLIRTFTRLIPFGFLTMLTPYNAPLHDLLSKTNVVRRKKKYVVEID